MSFIQRFLLGNRVEDDLRVGLFLKNDGTVWLRNPDGSETQVADGGGGSFPPPQWTVGTHGELEIDFSDDPDADYTGLVLKMAAAFDGFKFLQFLANNDDELYSLLAGDQTLFTINLGGVEGTSIQAGWNGVYGWLLNIINGWLLCTSPANTPYRNILEADFGGTGATLDLTFDAAVISFLSVQAADTGATITFVDPGEADQPLSVATDGSNITVSLATDGGGAITTMASEISALINSDPDASAVVTETMSGDDAVLTAVAQTHLTGGLQPAQAWGVAPGGQEWKTAMQPPSDDAVATSQVLEWFDDTVGAIAARFKAKDSGATVYLGQLVALLDDGTIKLPNLPTSDPAVADQLWNDTGTLKVSAGP